MKVKKLRKLLKDLPGNYDVAVLYYLHQDDDITGTKQEILSMNTMSVTGINEVLDPGNMGPKGTVELGFTQNHIGHDAKGFLTWDS